MQKQGKQTEYIFPKITDEIISFRKGTIVMNVNITATEINFSI